MTTPCAQMHGMPLMQSEIYSYKSMFKKEEGCKITFYPKTLEKEKQTKPRTSRRKKKCRRLQKKLMK